MSESCKRFIRALARRLSTSASVLTLTAVSLQRREFVAVWASESCQRNESIMNGIYFRLTGYFGTKS